MGVIADEKGGSSISCLDEPVDQAKVIFGKKVFGKGEDEEDREPEACKSREEDRFFVIERPFQGGGVDF